MQAIISDIIVNQAVQSGNLQVSQLTQNNSSSPQSFLEMLHSLRSDQTEMPEKKQSLKHLMKIKSLLKFLRQKKTRMRKKSKNQRKNLPL